MATSEVLMLLFLIFSSLGISFTSGAIGESLQDAFSEGDINFEYKVDEDKFKTILDLYSGFGNIKITEDMVNGQYTDNTISTADIANAGVNPSQWMLDNQDNIKFSADGSSLNIGDVKIRTFSFASRSAAFAAGFNASNYYGRDDVPYAAIGVFSADGTMIYSVVSSSEGRPSDPGTLETISINNIEFSYHGQGFDGYTCYHTITFVKNGVTVQRESTCDLRLPTSLYGNDIIEDLAQAAVGSAVIGGEVYDLNPDGSVTIDGETYTMNPDGSITVDGVKYYPQINPAAYDDTALRNLLNLILQRLDQIENELTFDNTIPDTDVSVPTYDGTMSEFVLNSRITQIFPFCLPFDFVRGIKLFNAQPATPVFEYDFKIPPIGEYKGDTVKIKIDFTPFEKLSIICRWVSTMGFLFSLIMITPKIVKGAG